MRTPRMIASDHYVECEASTCSADAVIFQDDGGTVDLGDFVEMVWREAATWMRGQAMEAASDDVIARRIEKLPLEP